MSNVLFIINLVLPQGNFGCWALLVSTSKVWSSCGQETLAFTWAASTHVWFLPELPCAFPSPPGIPGMHPKWHQEPAIQQLNHILALLLWKHCDLTFSFDMWYFWGFCRLKLCCFHMCWLITAHVPIYRVVLLLYCISVLLPLPPPQKYILRTVGFGMAVGIITPWRHLI